MYSMETKWTSLMESFGSCNCVQFIYSKHESRSYQKMDFFQKYPKVNIFICCMAYYKFLNATTSNIDSDRFTYEVSEQRARLLRCKKTRVKSDDKDAGIRGKATDATLKNQEESQDETSESDEDESDEADSEYFYSDDEQEKIEHRSIEHSDSTKPDWSLLWKPLRLYRVVARYHNCNWLTIMLLGYHLSFLFYLLLKTLLSSFIAYKYKANRIILHQYYRPLFHYLEPTLNVNSTMTTIICYMIFIRINFFVKLIRDSIINERRYVFIKPSQIMVGYLSLFYLSPKEYSGLLDECVKHDKLLHESNSFLDKHFATTINCSTNEYRDVKKLNRLYQRYYVTLIDSQACHKGADKYLLDPKKDMGWCANWHRSQPLQMCDLTYVRFMVLWTIFGGLFITSFILLAYLVTFYMHFAFNFYDYSIRELKTGQYHRINYENRRINDYLLFNKSSLFGTKLESLQANTWTQDYIPKYIPIRQMTISYLINKWLCVDNLISLSDNLLFITGQTAMYLDCSCLIYCVTLYYSQIVKIKQFMEYQLASIRRACMQPNLVGVLDGLKLNKQTLDCCEKLALLLDEIVDMRQEWSNCIDILVITNILVLAFNLVFFASVSKELHESLFAFLCILNAIAPLWVTLLAGSFAGRTWPKVYYTIQKLLVNQGKHLNHSTVSYLLQLSKRLEYDGNRSFLLLRKYAVTPLSLLTTMGWVSSIVILLYKATMR